MTRKMTWTEWACSRKWATSPFKTPTFPRRNVKVFEFFGKWFNRYYNLKIFLKLRLMKRRRRGNKCCRERLNCALPACKTDTLRKDFRAFLRKNPTRIRLARDDDNAWKTWRRISPTSRLFRFREKKNR